jgi:hypothetical protein
MANNTVTTNVPYFHVIPKTGVQVCRSFAIDPKILPKDVTPDKLWADAVAYAQSKEFKENQLINLISEHVACSYPLTVESTGWMSCQTQSAFFRLNRNSQTGAITADLVIDTNSNAGRQLKNDIPCMIKRSGIFTMKKPYEVAGFHVLPPEDAPGVTGALFIDFGNTGTTCLFAPIGVSELSLEPLQLENCWDPNYLKRSKNDREILHSNVLLMQIDLINKSPWIVTGERAKELIKLNPRVTYLYSPKKYIRHWAEHLKPSEPTTGYEGIIGVRHGMFPTIGLIEDSLRQLLQMIQGSITNPKSAAPFPVKCPIINQIMLTYPLTWRKIDRELFQKIFTEVAENVLGAYSLVQDKFHVEMVCSEPVAIVAYLIWENFFLLGMSNAQIMRSTLGNLDNTDELRILVIDIGGGSTDIALVDVDWQYNETDNVVDATFQMVDTMRFNRAGDRLTHFIVTAIWNFFKQKYNFDETLDLQTQSPNPSFDQRIKRTILSEITKLAESAKPEISKLKEWKLSETDEQMILHYLGDVASNSGGNFNTVNEFILTHDMLKEWIRHDLQGIKTHGEMGFMDIFIYLKELREYLERENKRQPNQIILSGRTSKMPFIRQFVVESLKIPSHRVRTIDEFWHENIRTQTHTDISKMAVVLGAQRFRTGTNIRFGYKESEPVFNHYIGTVVNSIGGFQFATIFICPGDTRPASFAIDIPKRGNIMIGHCFRTNGQVEVLASISSKSDEKETVELFFEDDFTISIKDKQNILFSERVAGGDEVFADNFCDTGKIDEHPKGFIAEIITKFTPAAKKPIPVTQTQQTNPTIPKNPTPPPPPIRKIPRPTIKPR